MNRTKKRILTIYFCLLFVAVLFAAFIGVTTHDETFDGRKNLSYELLTDFTHTQVTGEDYAQGILDVYTFALPSELEHGFVLAFYTIHCNSEVYIDGECVYTNKISDDTLIGHSPGDAWNIVPVWDYDGGKVVEVRTEAVYATHVGAEPEIYLGSIASIISDVIFDQLAPLICAIVVIVLGIVYIIITLVEYRKYDNHNGLVMIGMLAIVAGVWKICDLNVTHWYFGQPIFLTDCALLAMMLLVVPFAMYEMSLFEGRMSRVLAAICYLSLAATAISIILQMLNVADLRQTLWMHHVCIGLLVLASVALAIYEVMRRGWTRKLCITAICFIICVFGVACDFFNFYDTMGMSMKSLGMLGFLLYIAVLGLMSIREARTWIEKGHEAQSLENMAYSDEMTGFYNRNAYARDTSDVRFAPEDVTVVMFDLNELKHCNDTYGHEAGDRYICAAADLIQRTFGEVGDVYRIGGDEFCALCRGVSEDVCSHIRDDLQQLAEEYNASSGEPYQMKIACGIRAYDAERDYDISDTVRHADHRMYENKMLLKKL